MHTSAAGMHRFCICPSTVDTCTGSICASSVDMCTSIVLVNHVQTHYIHSYCKHTCRLCTYIATVKSCSFTAYAPTVYIDLLFIKCRYVPAVDTSISTADIYCINLLCICMHGTYPRLLIIYTWIYVNINISLYSLYVVHTYTHTALAYYGTCCQGGERADSDIKFVEH